MLHLVLTTKNKSIYVKTLHTLLGIENICAHANVALDVTFIDDDTVEKIDTLKRISRNADRLAWFDYGVSLNRECIPEIVKKFDGFDAVIFPCAREGVDWEMFKTKVNQGSSEPPSQMGLNFDVDISKKVLVKESDFYEVTKTHAPSCWVMDVKRVMKKLKDKKKEFVFPQTVPAFFDKCLARNVKIAAATQAITYKHFTHECVGNIMNMAGLKVTH